MLKNVNIILHKIKMKYSDIFQINKDELKGEFKKTETNADWRVRTVEELLDIRDRQLECVLNENEVSMMLKYICIFR